MRNGEGVGGGARKPQEIREQPEVHLTKAEVAYKRYSELRHKMRHGDAEAWVKRGLAPTERNEFDAIREAAFKAAQTEPLGTHYRLLAQNVPAPTSAAGPLEIEKTKGRRERDGEQAPKSRNGRRRQRKERIESKSSSLDPIDAPPAAPIPLAESVDVAPIIIEERDVAVEVPMSRPTEETKRPARRKGTVRNEKAPAEAHARIAAEIETEQSREGEAHGNELARLAALQQEEQDRLGSVHPIEVSGSSPQVSADTANSPNVEEIPPERAEIIPPAPPRRKGRGRKEAPTVPPIIDTTSNTNPPERPTETPPPPSFDQMTEEDLLRGIGAPPRRGNGDVSPDEIFASLRAGPGRDTSRQNQEPVQPEPVPAAAPVQAEVTQWNPEGKKIQHYKGREFYIDENTGEAIVKYHAPRSKREAMNVRDGHSFTVYADDGKTLIHERWNSKVGRFLNAEEMRTLDAGGTLSPGESKSAVQPLEAQRATIAAPKEIKPKKEEVAFEASAGIQNVIEQITPETVRAFAEASPSLSDVLRKDGPNSLARALQEKVETIAQQSPAQLMYTIHAVRDLKAYREKEYARVQGELNQIRESYKVPKDIFEDAMRARTEKESKALLRKAIPVEGSFFNPRAIFQRLLRRVTARSIEQKTRARWQSTEKRLSDLKVRVGMALGSVIDRNDNVRRAFLRGRPNAVDGRRAA